jgi:hypothetical protein
MQDDIRSLTAAWPLPPGYTAPEVFADEIEIAGVRIRRAGIQSTTPAGEEVTGSAAVLEGSPLERAYFELLERAALFDAAHRSCPIRDVAGVTLGVAPPIAPRNDPRSRPARSNGVALHRTWDEACRRAHHELVERDRTLGAWYGELSLVAAPRPACLTPFEVTHDWIARSVPAARGDVDAHIEVAVVVGFPREPGIPLARGFAGAGSLDAALTGAAAEAIQSLAFLWGEPVPAEAPALAPTPLFHLDYYLWPGNHEALREWLEPRAPSVPALRTTIGDQTRFVDLTPPVFGDALRVARAVRTSARELIFGEPPAQLRSLLPPSRHVHPIP